MSVATKHPSAAPARSRSSDRARCYNRTVSLPRQRESCKPRICFREMPKSGDSFTGGRQVAHVSNSDELSQNNWIYTRPSRIRQDLERNLQGGWWRRVPAGMNEDSQRDLYARFV